MHTSRAAEGADALDRAEGDLKAALVVALTDASPGRARTALDDTGGIVRNAVRVLVAAP